MIILIVLKTPCLNPRQPLERQVLKWFSQKGALALFGNAFSWRSNKT